MGIQPPLPARESHRPVSSDCTALLCWTDPSGMCESLCGVSALVFCHLSALEPITCLLRHARYLTGQSPLLTPCSSNLSLLVVIEFRLPTLKLGTICQVTPKLSEIWLNLICIKFKDKFEKMQHLHYFNLLIRDHGIALHLFRSFYVL